MQSELEVEKEMGKNFEEPTEDIISFHFIIIFKVTPWQDLNPKCI